MITVHRPIKILQNTGTLFVLVDMGTAGIHRTPHEEVQKQFMKIPEVLGASPTHVNDGGIWALTIVERTNWFDLQRAIGEAATRIAAKEH